MTTVFLDAQVWNYLADPGWTAPSGVSSPQMLAAVEGCEVVGSFELLQELMGTERSNRAKYLDMLDLFDGFVGNRILLPLNRRHVAEVHFGGPLPAEQRFANRQLRRDLQAESRRSNSVKEIADLAFAETSEFKRKEDEVRSKVQRDLEAAGESTRPERLRDWYRGMDIDAWVRDIIKDGVERGEFAAEAEEDFGPSRYPSAWMFTACRLARIPATVGEGRRIQGSDLADAHHIACSPYVDLVVTNDAELTRTSQLMCNRPLPLRCVTLEQFVEQ